MPEQFVQKPGTDEKITLASAASTLGVDPDLQAVSDAGGFSPVSAPVFGVSDVPKISEGSEDIQDQANLLDADIAGLDAGSTGPDTTGVDLGAEFENLKRMNANIGITSAAERTAIEEAGEVAGAGFDTRIADARERARQGQAQNIVATGRRGGFQRARFAGEAALGPTVGDVGFEGSGGKLEATASAFQRNIDELINQKNSAIALAKAQARQAQRTGKQEDFSRAKDMLNFARGLSKDQDDLEQQKFDNLFKIGQEQRQQAQATFNIISKIPAGETQTINGIEFTGIKKEELEPFYTGANIVSLMKDLPEGKTITVEDPALGIIEVTGTKVQDRDVATFTDRNGNVTALDKETGEPLWRAEGIAKGFKGTAGTGAGTSLAGLSTTERKNLVPLIEAIKGAGSREEALKSLEEDATTIVLQSGEKGLQILAAEIDAAFPEEAGGGQVITDAGEQIVDPFLSGEGSTAEALGQILRETPGAAVDIGQAIGSGIAGAGKFTKKQIDDLLRGLGL